MEYSKDRSNTLELYNTFLSNVGEKKTLQQLIDSIIKRKGKAVVLDLGCGNAGALNDLKKLYGARVSVKGIDLEKPEFNIDEFVQGNFLEAKLPQKNDLVFSFRALHESGEIEKMVSRTEQSLAPLGKALLVIRIADDKGIFEGQITEQDMEFLVKISRKKSIGNSKASGKAAGSPEGEHITGIVLVLERKA